jgi:hypothetical protein
VGLLFDFVSACSLKMTLQWQFAEEIGGCAIAGRFPNFTDTGNAENSAKSLRHFPNHPDWESD